MPTGLNRFQHSEAATDGVGQRHSQSQSLTPSQWREIVSFRVHGEQLNKAPALDLFPATLQGTQGDGLIGNL